MYLGLINKKLSSIQEVIDNQQEEEEIYRAHELRALRRGMKTRSSKQIIRRKKGNLGFHVMTLTHRIITGSIDVYSSLPVLP